MRQFYVDILSSRSRTPYVGVTNNLATGMAEHRLGKHGFTARYHINRLVYWEMADNPYAAITREKQIKGHCRAKKEVLTAGRNPGWDDLGNELDI